MVLKFAAHRIAQNDDGATRRDRGDTGRMKFFRPAPPGHPRRPVNFSAAPAAGSISLFNLLDARERGGAEHRLGQQFPAGFERVKGLLNQIQLLTAQGELGLGQRVSGAVLLVLRQHPAEFAEAAARALHEPVQAVARLFRSFWTLVWASAIRRSISSGLRPDEGTTLMACSRPVILSRAETFTM